MSTERATTRRKIADRRITSLGAFATLAVVWVVLELTARVADPFGVLSLLAGASFLSTLIALFGVIVVASSLLRR